LIVVYQIFLHRTFWGKVPAHKTEA